MSKSDDNNWGYGDGKARAGGTHRGTGNSRHYDSIDCTGHGVGFTQGWESCSAELGQFHTGISGSTVTSHTKSPVASLEPSGLAYKPFQEEPGD